MARGTGKGKGKGEGKGKGRGLGTRGGGGWRGGRGLEELNIYIRVQCSSPTNKHTYIHTYLFQTHLFE